ncbi:hypothetical protein M1B79_06935 [Bacteroides sp. KH365_2]|uniref:Uncharacterized protein n=1 Tax=Bacteroides muris (ex Fokt et al. 2023) TaxID=2937417 RepID=A0A9X2NR84_9BACE|nr:hypothetical protein [Bacteroides muris (ex Fokt et al. 2023)]MCR6504425.1 hypothetical protein [Bacteroides muris (ex Fokt et al. 2023)]
MPGQSTYKTGAFDFLVEIADECMPCHVAACSLVYGVFLEPLYLGGIKIIAVSRRNFCVIRQELWRETAFPMPCAM